MATITENLKLTKPDDTDFYDIQVYNKNLDIIDKEFKNANQKIEQLEKSLQKAIMVISEV